MRQATVYIRKQALKHNLQRVKQLAPQAKVVCMVKANAYGIGIQPAIESFQSADAFGVACLDEALTIRQLRQNKAITLIEGVFSAAEMPIAIEQRLECVVHHTQQLAWLIAHKDAYIAAGLKVWVKLNSGMNRLGFNAQEIIPIIQQLQDLGFYCVLTMHFANADVPEHPLNQQQIEQLLAIKAACSPIAISCCNSAAIFNWPELHFDYVRPGIMLYGASPFTDRSAETLGLKPVMQLQAEIIALHNLKKGEHIGYGSRFTAMQDMHIAIISMGYGDGYPRANISPNFVTIAGQLAPVVGRVSMDMMSIDISALTISVDLGTTVELWGDVRSVDDVAAAHGTIGYELLCRLTKRPKVIVID